MPFQLLIAAAVLAAASLSFAAEEAPTGAMQVASVKRAPGVPSTERVPVSPQEALEQAADDLVPAAEPAELAAAALPPKIINVPKRTDANVDVLVDPVHQTAGREQLLREFPEELVERMWIQDWTDLERLYQFGKLVDVTSDPVGRGIVLRLDGGSRIGELETDPYRQLMLCRLTKPAAGLLYRIAARMRLMEGEAYEPLEVTSLVRTWDYQLRLTDVNPNADRTKEGVPPTHVLGLAFDIARTAMSADRQERLEFLLDLLARDGDLAYYKEGSNNGLMHYHVIALPSANGTLVREFERGIEVAARTQEAQGRHRYAPEAPCVTFGSSLEPFSAICSCELPIEASASVPGSMGSAPISR